MIGKNTEKAIKAWLKLSQKLKCAEVLDQRTVCLFDRAYPDSMDWELVAKFTIASVVAKRLPRRKKAKAKK